MSATTALLILIVAWVVIGATAAVVMGRRGHAPFSWMLLGAVLGPLVIPVMLATMRREEQAAIPVAHSVAAAHEDGIDILFGFDGSEESKGAMVTAIALFGPHLGALTIATVLDYQPSTEEIRATEQQLTDVALLAASLLDRQPATAILFGRPDEALVRHAHELAVRLLVIAPRGAGATRALFGSVATRLARAPEIPVAIMPPATRESRHP